MQCSGWLLSAKQFHQKMIAIVQHQKRVRSRGFYPLPTRRSYRSPTVSCFLLKEAHSWGRGCSEPGLLVKHQAFVSLDVDQAGVCSWIVVVDIRLELDIEQQTGSKLGKEYVKAVYCHPCLFNLYAEYIM